MDLHMLKARDSEVNMQQDGSIQYCDVLGTRNKNTKYEDYALNF